MFQKRPDPPNLDSAGAIGEEWPADFEWWAQYEPLGSAEFPQFEKRFEQTTGRFRIPYRRGISASLHRIAFTLDYSSPVQVQLFDIYPPLPVDGKRVELVIEAVEIH